MNSDEYDGMNSEEYNEAATEEHWAYLQRRNEETSSAYPLAGEGVGCAPLPACTPAHTHAEQQSLCRGMPRFRPQTEYSF